jgi:hypothetical protein
MLAVRMKRLFTSKRKLGGHRSACTFEDLEGIRSRLTVIELLAQLFRSIESLEET